jgi:genome maintenance exonuclease 1
MFTHTDFKFDEIETKQINGKRHYITPKGNFPSITTVLSILSRKGIAEWRERLGAEAANKISTMAARRGTNVHLMCEHYINNELDDKKFMPNEREMFNSIKPILNEYIDNVVAQEVPLWSSYLGIAGRVDCIAEYEGRLSVIDFKTSRKPKKREWIGSYFQQASAYCVMFEERTGTPIDQIVIIIAVEDNKPEVYVEKRDNHIMDCIDTIHQYYQEQIDIKS